MANQWTKIKKIGNNFPGGQNAGRAIKRAGWNRCRASWTSVWHISFSVGAILAFIAALKDKEHMKSVELAKKDERLQNITMRSKAKAFDVITYLLSFATAVLFVNKVVSTDALIILGVLNLSLLIIQAYYFCKYSKEM